MKKITGVMGAEYEIPEYGPPKEKRIGIDWTWALITMTVVLIAAFKAGYEWGKHYGGLETIQKLQYEAVREKAGVWTAGETGDPVFKWKVCVFKDEVKPTTTKEK